MIDLNARKKVEIDTSYSIHLILMVYKRKRRTSPLNTKVFYFPQGHAEHSQSPVVFPQGIPSLVLCPVASVKFLADPGTDEVFAKISLIPLPDTDLDFSEHVGVCADGNDSNNAEKPASFAFCSARKSSVAFS
uniref:Uncharacterized protein n=1 Tax=Salix viminalis TaxID=40686 RepID=A0A6N2KXX6_SALVM